MEKSDTRLDKFLWAIRIFKTRTIATQAIEGGKVKLDSTALKASKKVKIGEIYIIKREQQTLELEVLKIIDKRVSAPLAQECYKEISNSIKSLENQESSFLNPNIYREKGKGRPTKRERRDIDDFNESDI